MHAVFLNKASWCLANKKNCGVCDDESYSAIRQIISANPELINKIHSAITDTIKIACILKEHRKYIICIKKEHEAECHVLAVLNTSSQAWELVE